MDRKLTDSSFRNLYVQGVSGRHGFQVFMVSLTVFRVLDTRYQQSSDGL